MLIVSQLCLLVILNKQHTFIMEAHVSCLFLWFCFMRFYTQDTGFNVEVMTFEIDKEGPKQVQQSDSMLI